MKALILIGGLISFSAFANCNTAIATLKGFEGFSDKPYKDGANCSVGYGSQGLCKKMKAQGRHTTTKKEAEKYLRTVDFPYYHKQTQKLGFNATEREICLLATVVYQKGAGRVAESGLVGAFNDYKLAKKKKKQQRKKELEFEMLKLACQNKNGKLVGNNRGLAFRQALVFQMLIDPTATVKEILTVRDVLASSNEGLEIQSRVRVICENANLTLDVLIDRVIKNNA